MKRNTTPQTEAISRIDTSGNMIPVNWYKTIQKQESKSGKIARKPHLLAINILADIVYWHKNTMIRDEITAEVIEVRKRFAADLLQRSYASIVNMFGCSDKDAREAVAFLESLGLITRVFRNIPVPQGIMPNVMYINVHAAIIEMATITNTPLPQTSEMCPQNGGDVPPKEETSIDETGEYTDTTTNTTTDSTTKESPTISFEQAQPNKLHLERKKESHPPVPLTPPPLKNKGKKDRASIAIPTSLNNADFLAEWQKLLQTKKWKGKEDSTLEGILEKLSTFDVRFATELANQARLNEWQGIIFAQTGKNYEMWLKSNPELMQSSIYDAKNFFKLKAEDGIAWRKLHKHLLDVGYTNIIHNNEIVNMAKGGIPCEDGLPKTFDSITFKKLRETNPQRANYYAATRQQ